MAIEDVLGCMKQPQQSAVQFGLPSQSVRQRSLISACLAALVGASLALSGCGSNSVSQNTQELPPLDSEESESETTPPLTALGDGDPLLSPVPEFVVTETRADTGIQVAYTSESQLTRVDAAFVESQWQFMQTCLELVSPPPLVIIIDGSISPFTPADDVLFGFDGKVNASASVSASVSGTSLVIQVRVADFDGSLGNPGFNLRSIMGRSLWLSAGMAEKDYPFACARTVAESS